MKKSTILVSALSQRGFGLFTRGMTILQAKLEDYQLILATLTSN
jgi:hypothetical protein